jgi:hypothetical protein
LNFTVTLQRAIGDFADMCRPAIQAQLLAARGVDLESEFAGDHDLVTHRGERFADQFFIRERSVDLGGVEEGDPSWACSTPEALSGQIGALQVRALRLRHSLVTQK